MTDIDIAILAELARVRESADAFPTITQFCDADTRSNSNSNIGNLNIFIVSKLHEEIFGEEESNV